MGAVAQRLDQGRITFERSSDSTLVAHLSGPWHLQRDLPPISLLLAELDARPGVRRLAYETGALTHWDSGLISSPRIAPAFRQACGACSNWPRRCLRKKARAARRRVARSSNASVT
jgi:hypothetical protein